jgi:hypothetical protein
MASPAVLVVVGLNLLLYQGSLVPAARLTVVDCAYGHEKENQEEAEEINLKETCKEISRQEDEADQEGGEEEPSF